MAPRAESKPDDAGLSTAYLVAYNVAQIMGWSAIMLIIWNHFIQNGNFTNVYEDTAPLLNIFQTAAVLEIVHCAVGLVRSNVMVTTLQVFSRVMLTWGIAHSVPEVQTNIAVFMFLLAWTVTEIIRYSFYFFGLLGKVPYFLVWCRYTFFIVLYPVGVTGELLAVYHSLPFVRKTGMYSVTLPNAANISFDYFYFLIFFMLSYIPAFPHLYFHMFAQRKKVIGGAAKKRD